MDWPDYNQYHNYQSYEDEKYLHSNLVCHEDGKPLRLFPEFAKEPTCSYVFKDGVCDDFANNEDCFFDGGDCCLAKINSIRHSITLIQIQQLFCLKVVRVKRS